MLTSLLPHVHQHAERLDMQLDPTCLGERRKRGKAVRSDISTGKRGTNAIPAPVPVPVPSACLRYEEGKRGKQLRLPVDEKEGASAAPSICRRERGELHFVARCLIEASGRTWPFLSLVSFLPLFPAQIENHAQSPHRASRRVNNHRRSQCDCIELREPISTRVAPLQAQRAE
jgi:hypothetical protein